MSAPIRFSTSDQRRRVSVLLAASRITSPWGRVCTLPRLSSENCQLWLNSPLCLAGMGALMVLSVLLSSALHSKGRSYWTKFDGTQSNRMFSFCYFIAMHEIHRGTDILFFAQ